MRTHRLERLNLRGQADVLRNLPDFDFYHLHEVKRLEWQAAIESDFSKSTLTLLVVYDNGETKPLVVQLKCFGVCTLKLPTLASGFWLNELEIEDLRSSQLEGIRYKLKDHHESDLEILCEEFEVTEWRQSDSGANP
jgi:hypothetical protein